MSYFLISLCHFQTDLMGQSLFTVTALEDHEKLRMYLTGDGEMMPGWKKYFTVKIKRAGPKSETPQYESVRMMGVHKNLLAGRENVNNNEENGQGSCSSSTSSLPAAMNSEPLVDRLVIATRDEYRTRHLIDGRIVGCDQRISLIAGYMIDEIQGHSAFQYMHKEEVRFVMIALRQSNRCPHASAPRARALIGSSVSVYDKGESKGNSCYRLKSRNGNFIYLKTFGFLEIDENGIVESFLCVNVLVDEQEGKELINEMKRRFSALFTSSLANLPQAEHAGPAWKQNVPALPTISPSKVDRTEDPQALELAINELMQNLPSPEMDDSASPCSGSDPQCSPIAKVPALFVNKTPEFPAAKPPHLRISKSNGKRGSNESPDHVKRQRLTSVDSQPPQLSPSEMPFCNGPLVGGTESLKMPKLEEQYSPSDLLRHRPS
ncbi:hypothetical protein HUJ04_008693 [Dendroctonus ponderosae]|nr:hypothetical protein HUJ04_008693 [Dendroctonus ponderosae]